MLLMIDNYDSFTYNLVQYFQELGEEVQVVRNDEATVEELLKRKPDRVCISPGPCAPAQAGISKDAIVRFRSMYRCWESVSGIRLSEKSSAGVWFGRERLCMARQIASRMTVKDFSAVCLRR